MVKLVITFRRRTDLSQEQFEHHWRTVHGPLVERHATAMKLVRYSQSRNLRNDSTDRFVASRGWSGDCDGLTEIWWNSESEMTEALASPAGQAASAELRADELNFCDMSSVVAFLSEDRVVLDGVASAEDDHRGRRR